MHLNIHLEYDDDKGKRFLKLAKIGKPFSISPVPVFFTPESEIYNNGIYPKDYHYSDEITGVLKEILQEPQITLGQQGYTHFCNNCFKNKDKKDMWHENKCLYQKTFSLEKQSFFIQMGKKILEDNIGMSPVLYVPPNHQLDDNTKRAAKKNGFRYFTVQGILNIPPYSDNGLIIFPERKPKKQGEIFYAHYDQMQEDMNYFLDLINNSAPLNKVHFSEKPDVKVFMNDKLVLLKKRGRDLKKLVF